MKKVLFYPDPPIQLPGHSLSKTISYFQAIGYELTNDINSDWDIGVHWTRMDGNKTKCDVPERLLRDKRIVFNRCLNNISKSYVDEIFTEVFGYSSLANTDKISYCVKKSERQGVHDGVIIKTPCKKENGFIYQKLIDNRMAINVVYDIRLPVVSNEIPFVYIKTKGIEGTFEHNYTRVKDSWLAGIREYLSISEENKIRMFCGKIGFDLGEIDVLRDNSTGKLYIIDVNHTPGGVTSHSWPNTGSVLMKRMVEFMKEKIDG